MARIQILLKKLKDKQYVKVCWKKGRRHMKEEQRKKHRHISKVQESMYYIICITCGLVSNSGICVAFISKLDMCKAVGCLRNYCSF